MPVRTLDDVLPLHLADVTFPPDHPLSGQNGQLFAFAIRQPDGVILFETGIGRGNDRLDAHYQVVHRPLDGELERHGHRIDEVRAVVNSHLHFDHCGSNRLFPGVPIYAHPAELLAARQPRYTIPEWVEFPGAEYREIDGDTKIGDGVTVVSTPGHSPGHQSALVDTDAGTVVLAGQAVYSRAEYEHILATGEVPPDDPQPDPDSYAASARRLIGLRPRRVHFSHDAATWEG